MVALKTITKEELKDKLDSGEDFILVNVLSEDSFESMHIPGSINADIAQDDFLDKIEEVTGGDNDQEIVVYCSSSTCQASPAAARKLEDAGYPNVFHYKGGMADWKDAGYEIDGVMSESEI